MAYAALISLKHARSKRPSKFFTFFPCPLLSRDLRFIYENNTKQLQQILEKSNESSSRRSRSSMERLDTLDEQLRICVNKLEDSLRFHELNLYEGKHDDGEVMQVIVPFAGAATKTAKDYLDKLSRDDDDDAEAASENTDFGVEMVGNSSEFNAIKGDLLCRMRPHELCFFTFSGEEGSGRTRVANNTFEDLRDGEAQLFDCYAWVSLGKEGRELKEVLMSIISQVDGESPTVSDEELSKFLYNTLEDRRYMIVLDDVNDVEVVDHLRMTSFPDRGNGSIVFLTTTSNDVVQSADRVFNYESPPGYFEERMWFVLRLALLEFESIPEELEAAGRKIIENCRRHYVAAAKALVFLFNSEKTVEQWIKLAEDKGNPIFMVADEMLEITKIKMEMDYYNEVIVDMISIYVDFSLEVENVKMQMHPERFSSSMQIISLLGMAGIGKSTLARKIFNDKLVSGHFDHCVWITLGPKYKSELTLIDILDQIYPEIHKLDMEGDEKLVWNLCVKLSCKRCLIVLDDLWNMEPLFNLKFLATDIKGTTLVTTRLATVAVRGGDTYFEMKLLDNGKSWRLLHQKVFGGESCPFELEKAGRRIAEKCDGLPLLILTVAVQLLEVEQSEENWNDIASGKEKIVFKNAHDQISKALLPSYHSLPQHLKACFLYMGVFREKYEISTSKLSDMWIVEGFLEPKLSQMQEDLAANCLYELVDRNLVIVQRRQSDFKIKTCRHHSVFWHLSNDLVLKNKLFHVVNSCSIESMESQRRLCIRSNALLGMSHVQNSMASCTNAQSLLCVGPLHQYPVPLNFNLRLLRVMDALTIRLYGFPIEVVTLVHLKYLSLTCDGNLPTSISKLWKLQYLIVKKYMNIKSSKRSLPLPVDIWDMKELEHLEIMGGLLPNRESGPGLLKLTTLLDVSVESCRKKVLKWIPNLKRLGIQIELAPNDKGDSFRCLNRISRLRKLESLKCVVVNPHIRSKVVAPPPPVSMFPTSLKKLSLSGMRYPWKYMSIISKLKNLEVLKLKFYAFEGPKWEITLRDQFEKLKYLLVEDTNLKQWKVNWATALALECLCIKHCYKLKELPTALLINDIINIEIVDCTPSTVSWAEQLGKMLKGSELKVHHSWFE